MKFLGLFILTLTMLYNTKVSAGTSDGPVGIFHGTEAELLQIKIDKTRPLRVMSKNLENYLSLLKIYNEFKKHDKSLAADLLKKVQNNNTFSGDDLYKIKKAFELMSKLNTKIIEFGDVYEYKRIPMARTFGQNNPKDPMMKAHFIRLSAYLAVIDHVRDIHALLFAQDGSLRRIIKATVEGTRAQTLKEMIELIRDALEVVEDKKFSQQVILVRTLEAELREQLKDDPAALFLINEIIESTTSKDIAKGMNKFNISGFKLEDSAAGIINKLSNTLSQFFGNVAGSIKWRKGFLFDSEPALELVKTDLQPMDLLLEKSPFVLTDKFIPGHYGHVALYLGTKEQLISIGMWNHPSLAEYQDEIEAGNVILEAVRSGVRLSSLEVFLNIDEVTIVRKEDILTNPGQLNEQISRGIDQIGKAYDFNFDITTLDKIVCSELLYIVYGNVKWPTQYRLGRATVTPDDLAEILFQKNSRFKVKNYVISTKRHRIEQATTTDLANIFDYELRSTNGDPISNETDPANSFWKKYTKCYNLPAPSELGEGDSVHGRIKTCRTTYKEFYYEEWGL